VENLVLSLGAGVYEELVFRLICFTLLSLFFIDFLGFSKKFGGLWIVLIGALAFSAYHYLGDEPFAWRAFLFRTAAGIYFGVLYLLRGFGITAGSHAAYDIFVAFLRHAT
jgi:membrane protease YdiL (CAAX protease family)